MEKPQKLPSGRWRQRFTGPDGKRYSTTDESARKVQQKAAQELSQLILEHQSKLDHRAASREARANPRRRFDLYAESYLQMRRPGEPDGYSRVVYRKRLNQLKTLNRTFGPKFVQAITVDDVRKWWIGYQHAKTERSNLYYFLHAIFEQAVDDELIQRTPCRVKGASKSSRPKRPTFSDDDVEKILGATTDPQMRVLIQVLMGTALRIGELVALDWGHIGFFERRLHVVQHMTPVGMAQGTKTGEDETRSIDLPGWVLELLETWYTTTGPDGPIFRNKRGARLSIDSAERAFRVIRATVGLDTIRLHDCRHAALSRYARQPGVTLADFMAFGGHKSVAVAMRYQHTDDERGAMHARNTVAPRWVKS